MRGRANPCGGTRFGCCSDAYTAKIDGAGSNCPQKRTINNVANVAEMVRLVTEAQKAYADVVRDLEKAQEQLKAAKFELGQVTESTCTSVPDPGLVQKPAMFFLTPS